MRAAPIMRLAATPHRRALLREGARTLLGVLGSEHRIEKAALPYERVGIGVVGGHRDDLLGGAHREGTVGGDP